MSGKQLTPKTKPELKIISYFLFVALLFVFDNLTVYLFACALLGLFFLKIPVRTVKSGWLPISAFLLFTFISNIIGRDGRVLLSTGLFLVTDEGLHIAAVRTLRVFLMIGGAKVLMASAKAEEMVDGLGRLFGPLERVGLPIRDFFHTMGLTMKCFPVLKNMASEAYRENKQTSAEQGFWGRARNVSAFLMPLFVRSLQYPESFFEKQQPARPAGAERNLGP
jgi:energy-coupling factor transport system permease protein